MLPILLVSKNQNKQIEYLDQFKNKEAVKDISIQRVIPEKSFSIEDVRNIKKTIFLKAFSGDKKVLIIHDFDSASIDAQNAMLKILEEPPLDTQIFLLAQTDNLLPTVLSRCKVVKLEETKQKIDENIFLEFQNLIQANISEKFYFAQEKSKDKKELLKWIEDSAKIISEKIKEEENQIKIQNYYLSLKKLNEAHYQLIKTNVQPRFIMENLLLSIG